MEQSIIPSSLLQCMNDDGDIDDDLLALYMQQQYHDLMIDDDMEEQLNNLTNKMITEEIQLESGSFYKTKKRKRTCFRYQINRIRDPTTGEIIEVTPHISTLYQTYVVSPDLQSTKFVNRFRRRFRCSYQNYTKLFFVVNNNPMFKLWKNKDAAGRNPSTLELLVLGALRYLGRGWTFDGLEENTSISEECHQQFLHRFITWASTELYNMYVIAPSSYDEADTHMTEMREAGFEGCVGSVDATHICMRRCPYS